MPFMQSEITEGWKKTLCQICIDCLVKEEASSTSSYLTASVKELDATIQPFRSSLTNPSLSQPSTAKSSQGSLFVPVVEAEVGRPTQEGNSSLHFKEDSEEGMEDAPSKCKLSLEQVDGLLKAIYATLGLEEERK